MSQASLETVAALAEQLSSLDRVRLVEQIMASLEHDLAEQQKQPRRSLRGLWPEVSLSEDDKPTQTKPP